MIYDFFTLYLLIGLAVWLDHYLYCYDVASDYYKAELVKFSFFIVSIICFPVVLCATMSIRIDVFTKLRKWKKENGFK